MPFSPCDPISPQPSPHRKPRLAPTTRSWDAAQRRGLFAEAGARARFFSSYCRPLDLAALGLGFRAGVWRRLVRSPRESAMRGRAEDGGAPSSAGDIGAGGRGGGSSTPSAAAQAPLPRGVEGAQAVCPFKVWCTGDAAQRRAVKHRMDAARSVSARERLICSGSVQRVV